MKKRYILTIATATLSLTGCYISENFDNQVQVSRTGQYQVDVETDVTDLNLSMAQQESKARKMDIPAKDLKEIFDGCEKEFNQVVARDAQKGKHIVSSKYLGECRGHLTLKYTGNIITEKKFEASIGSRENGFFVPVSMKYDAKTKQITINSNTKGDKSAVQMYGLIQYNGKLSVKTDGKVISTNADSKPYWGLLGSYKWSIKDITTPNAEMTIATSGI